MPNIALTVPEAHAFIAMIRKVGRKLLSHHSASPQDTDDLEVVLGELCANVTRHAPSERGCYRVTTEHLGDRFALTVADEGQGFDPQQLPPWVLHGRTMRGQSSTVALVYTSRECF